MSAAFETPGFVSAPPPDISQPTQSAVRVARGEFNVNNMIDDVLNRELYAESPRACFFMPHDYGYFYDVLFSKYRHSGAFLIKCLFEFSKSEDMVVRQRNENLDVIKTLLPFIMRSRGGFEAYYFYSSSPLRERSIFPMPYYLITSQYALTITADIQTAILHFDPAVRDCYSQIFADAKTKARPLIFNITSMLETVNYYGSKTGVVCNGISGFGSHPCISYFLDRDIINGHMSAELPQRDMIVDMTASVYDHMNNTANNGISASYFTLEGLNIFVGRGLIETLSDRIFLPFSTEERKNILSLMISATENNLPVSGREHLLRAKNHGKKDIRIESSHVTLAFSGELTQVSLTH